MANKSDIISLLQCKCICWLCGHNEFFFFQLNYSGAVRKNYYYYNNCRCRTLYIYIDLVAYKVRVKKECSVKIKEEETNPKPKEIEEKKVLNLFMHIFNLTSFSQKCCVILWARVDEGKFFVWKFSSNITAIRFFFLHHWSVLLVSRSLPPFIISNIEFWRILPFFIYYSICPLSLYGLQLSNCIDCIAVFAWQL